MDSVRIMKRLAAGDAEAVRALYQQYGRAVFSVCKPGERLEPSISREILPPGSTPSPGGPPSTSIAASDATGWNGSMSQTWLPFHHLLKGCGRRGRFEMQSIN
jgi:hypothetical protein